MKDQATPFVPQAFMPAINPIADCDSYKLSHGAQYPEGTTHISSYAEARKAWDGIEDVVFFGLQAELLKLAGQAVTLPMVEEGAEMAAAHGLPFDRAMWTRVATDLGGRLPVRIDALPEGTVALVGVPLFRVTNTQPGFAALTSFLETRLLRATWYGTTVASLSRHVMGEIRTRLIRTDGSDDGLPFKLHDFGARGVSSLESAAIGGAAHLVSSMGTDTFPALMLARKVYGADMAGFSIPATEHSVMTALGEAGEVQQMERLLDANPTGLVACVSDSYDLFRAIRDYWGGSLRDKVLARDGVLVVRPDSGDPMEIVPQTIEALMTVFGSGMTPQGFRLLNPKVRVIQGDGIDRHSIIRIMDRMIERGLAIGNIAFGMGGGLLQQVNRDCFGFSMKASAIRIGGGDWQPIFKDPVTAGGAKRSKKGVQGTFVSDSGKMVARPAANIPPGADALLPVFEDGRLLRVQTFDQIRARARLT
ncbi:nicotinate phosphoribosyltransferase [Jannaschia pohangensis]|uniref:Nicotinamide phosphoribosyltransferase n=1 Tax=Jannaschia pohangensis TaxID=390807 RepID=A0A1I3JM35_9RHOB|nr:nicotinate phosphoribosyltransferase [Jannaschia pohangensis]SFI61224.1 nicotinamide phosphoribosyltransferase [Jannaschia pohangensis]